MSCKNIKNSNFIICIVIDRFYLQIPHLRLTLLQITTYLLNDIVGSKLHGDGSYDAQDMIDT